MVVKFKMCMTFVLGLMVAACTTRTTATPISEISPTPTSIASAIATPTSIPEIPSTPLSTVSMDDRLLASISGNKDAILAEAPEGIGPDEIVFLQGFIWTHSDYGYVIQIDPTNNKMISAVKTDTTSDPNHYCQGLGTDGNDIWACSASGDADHWKIDVVRVDPTSGHVEATFEVEKIFNQFYMPYALDQIWVLSGNADKLIGIDVNTDQPNPAIELGAHCLQLAAFDNFLYVTCRQDNLILKIDPVKKEVVSRQTLEGPDFIVVDKNGVWVSNNNAITRLDTQSLEPLVKISGISYSDIYPTEGAIWIWEYEKAVLYKIDPATNQVVELIKPDKPYIKGGGILVTSDSIWLSATEDELLLRLGLK